ncbi:MAG TPA: DinB family protein [Terriglobales bacterium]|nr:DinB family protein [Terriglobales bacterium]
MPGLDRIVEKLHRAQRGFLSAADLVPPDLWRLRPADGGWSAGEIVAHLCQVERTILGTADRIIRHAPKAVPIYKRFHLPLLIVESRIIRRRSPIPLDAELIAEKESMLADLRTVRERTLAFLEETSSRNLRPYFWPHAFLGMLNAYEWFEMIASHEIRHTKQVKALAKEIPKVVVTSQK